MYIAAVPITQRRIAPRPWLFALIVAASYFGLMERSLTAGPPRTLPPGEVPADTRLGPLRGERGDFLFVPAQSSQEWKQRAEYVRRILLVTLGLWPMPTRSPLNPVIHGTIDQGDYTVGKVYFESIPGFYVTGNLYRPKGKTPRRPGVLSPHGHFPGGRFHDAGLNAIRRQIAGGAERFEDGGRSFMQSRCVQLARMGCVVFHYDMIGYGDSVQIPLDVAHRFSQSRVKFKKPPARGLYSASAELNLQNPMGLHTYNSIRALDFLISLPDVDPGRIAVTGGSGGGTQTFMLCAVDERPLVSVPVVIVSTTRQGGCTCENISGLRIGTYNLEFTALHAPKPLLLISADDATRTMPERGFPELKQHYRMLGAIQNVSHVALLQFPHNYNHVSRAAMYHWLNRHLDIGLAEPILENSYNRLTREELSVWNDQHPRPESSPDFELRLLEWLTNDAERQIAALVPHDARSLQRYRQVVGGAWDILLRNLADDPELGFKPIKSKDRGNYRETLGILRYRSIEDHHAKLPTVVLAPKEAVQRTVIWTDERGKSGLYANDGAVKPPIRSMLDAGVTVIGVDLLYQGEFVAEGQPNKRQRWLPDEEAFAGWTYCYNLPLFACRVHDILAAIAWVKHDDAESNEVDVVGLNGTGPLVAAAVAQAQGAVARAAIDTAGFRFADLKDIYDIDFVPGAAKYDDLPGLLAISAPTRLWLAGEGQEAPSIVSAAYAAASKAANLTIFSGESQDTAKVAVEWLLRQSDTERPLAGLVLAGSSCER
ncbi:MAG: alpha/beta hydrolase family protein [Planctomycetota bacterium]